MNHWQPSTDTPNPARKSTGIFATAFLILFATPFAGFGLVVLVGGIRKFVAGEKDGLVLCGFGLMFSLIGFGLMFAAIWGRTRARQSAELEARFVDKPWMVRADWAAGRIKSSAMTQPYLILLPALAFAGIGGLMALHFLPMELHRRNYVALVVLIFPAIGLGFLVVFLRACWARARYGQCFFETAEVPTPLGGTLSGMIQTGSRLQAKHGLHVKISCVRRVVSGSGENRSTSESVLWQDEKVFKPEADLPEYAPGRTGIPVFFKLPDGQPQCIKRGDVSVSWRLEARAKMPGPDFVAKFEIPVFLVAGAAAEAADQADPTAVLQMPIEELRRDEHSKIRVTDNPGGREFYFPAARNPGAALFTTVIAAALDGGVVMIIHAHGPIIFAIFLGLFGVLLSCFMLSLWFKSSRVTINPAGVTAVNHWLLFTRCRKFAAGEVAGIETSTGMTSGTKTYLDLRLVRKSNGDNFDAERARVLQTGQRPPLPLGVSDPRGVAIASGIASAAEANWLAREMNRALGRGAS
jgi:hypothetical protein